MSICVRLVSRNGEGVDFKVGLTVMWHHLGREHGGLKYTEDIRKNPPEVIEQYIKLKEEWIRQNDTSHKFQRFDENTLVEVSCGEDLIIIYMIDKGIQLSLNAKSKTKYPWWVIDIVDIVEVCPNVFCSQDLFIDVKVHKDGSYHVLDIDEFETAIALDVLTNEQITKALKSFHNVLEELNNTEKKPISLIEEAEAIRNKINNEIHLKYI